MVQTIFLFIHSFSLGERVKFRGLIRSPTTGARQGAMLNMGMCGNTEPYMCDTCISMTGRSGATTSPCTYLAPSCLKRKVVSSEHHYQNKRENKK